MISNFYEHEEVLDMGFSSVGENVLISRKASVYGPQNIRIGANVRIDDFCLLSGNITICNHIHIAAYTSLCGGQAGIILEDFVNLSRKIEVFAVTDDFSGRTLTNPMIPDQYKSVQQAEVILHKHVLVGATSVILPGVVLGEGCVVGALSLVKNDLAPWSINSGIPARKIKDRSRELLKLEKQFLGNSHE